MARCCEPSCPFFARPGSPLRRCSVCDSNLSAAQLATLHLRRKGLPDELVAPIMLLAHAPMASSLRKEFGLALLYARKLSDRIVSRHQRGHAALSWRRALSLSELAVRRMCP